MILRQGRSHRPSWQLSALPILTAAPLGPKIHTRQSTMIRRPPSAIPLKQDDIEEMESFLAERRAAMEAADQAEAEAMQVEQQDNNNKGKNKSKSNATTNSKSKGKGKQRAAESHVTPADDSLIEIEQQARLAREAKTKEQRIGL
jgi:hypothetical protein